MQLTFLSQKKSCWRLTVTYSLPSSPLLKDVDVIFRCVREDVSKPAVGSAEVDRNDDISFNNLRRHVRFESPTNGDDKWHRELIRRS